MAKHSKDQLYSAIVNQKLAFARVELAAAASQDGDAINARLARHAHLDSALAQLCGALTYFVAEVGEQYSLAFDPAMKSPSLILTEFSESGTHSAEIAELLSLRKKEGTWLRDLLSAAANPLYLAQRFSSREREDPKSGEFIQLVDVTQIPSDLGSGKSPLELLKEWARSTQAIVDRQRGSLHEE